ncbi:hypothetical protein PENTCL1PPCAC_19521, partial [Pristionchus entomophagus]
ILLVVFAATSVANLGGARRDVGSDSVDKLEVSPEARMRAKLMPREYGWGDDKHAPALRIKDEDREHPARERSEWMKWRQTLGAHRTYHNATHEELAARIFEQTEALAEMHQKAFEKGEVTYTTAVNSMADLTQAEFDMMLTNEAFKDEQYNVNATSIDIPHELALPAHFDWRNKIQFPPVKNQGSCGSCYAFSTIGTIEAHLSWKKGISADLSEQWLIDCTRKVNNSVFNNGCKGGYPAVTYNWLVSSKRGILADSSSPYLYGNGDTHKACPQQSASGIVKIKSFTEVQNPRENVFADLLYIKGPLDTAMHAENIKSFRDYSGGVFSYANCPKTPNHAVVAVGFGAENGKNYWTIRNSWGTNWGIQGYLKLARGVNMCGFPALAVWPDLA